ncbi:hypothetical protein [Alteribacillus sp. HJP-4]|uniref:hypothetical protein n=1 Tax=Alteribacillus sp. HJP-4 TaxID=2775394 RepID=UPI0035CD136B
MKVEAAKSIAQKWVEEEVGGESWFRGAFFSGSVMDLEAEEELPADSDLDIMVVTSFADPPLKPGKFVYEGVLLEVSYLAASQFRTTEEVLNNYHLANSLRVNNIITDPQGKLRPLQKEVEQKFYTISSVRQRCEIVKERIELGLRSNNLSKPFHEQVTGWLFPTGITTHLLLVAALRNPTVRLRYLKVQEVLQDYNQLDLYPELLSLLGCVDFTREQVEYHLGELARTYDTAAELSETPFFFSSDISVQSRPIAIDGSRKLIEAGFHREAIFWMVATFARCHMILAADATEEQQQQHLPAFKAIVSDLGIHTSEDMKARSYKMVDFLPRLWKSAEKIMKENSRIM